MSRLLSADDYRDRIDNETLTVNGNELKLRRDKDNNYHLSVDGVNQEASSFVYEPIGTLVYSDGDVSKAFALYISPDDFLDVDKEFSFSERSDNSWTYAGVSYGYATGYAGKAPIKKSGTNGVIRYDGTIWGATLGEVELNNGRLNGVSVNGTATLGDMRGKFRGNDGIAGNNEGKRVNTSWGAFAGDNGTDSSFAGQWLYGIGLGSAK